MFMKVHLIFNYIIVHGQGPGLKTFPYFYGIFYTNATFLLIKIIVFISIVQY